MPKTAQILPDQTLEQIAAIAQRSGITYVALFGSAARGDDRPDSDIDLAVRFGRRYSLFDLVGAQLELAAALGKPVDLIPIDDAYPFVRESMEADLIVLFEDDAAAVGTEPDVAVLHGFPEGDALDVAESSIACACRPNSGTSRVAVTQTMVQSTLK